MSTPDLIAINVGNSRTQVGVFAEGELGSFDRFENERPSAAVESVVAGWREVSKTAGGSIVVASVNDAVADDLVSAIADQLSTDVYRIGADIPIPIGVQLDRETITGPDRLLNAAAAWDALQQACVIIDAGTAVTVDFVDGTGVFQGGAIAPGARLQLAALHGSTTALPEIPFAAPDPGEAFGRSTTQAMLHGVYHGIRGMAWKLIERYAEAYEAYPTVVATGGDAELLFAEDELVDRIVPALTVRGIAVAARHALAARPEDEE